MLLNRLFLTVILIVAIFSICGCLRNSESNRNKNVEKKEPETIEAIIGISENDARKMAEEEGREFRVRRRDGNHFPGTHEHIPSRINVEIENGVVVSAKRG